MICRQQLNTRLLKKNSDVMLFDVLEFLWDRAKVGARRRNAHPSGVKAAVATGQSLAR
jgi:hypothetical protein